MDAIDTENSNDSTDKIKEKVRVVSLEDPSIIASDFASNSNSSVWSLCGLNSDDHHVDLGDISPSISPILFTEQQMADHLRDRLIAEDQIFSGEHASTLNANDNNSGDLPDVQSHLELFDREMKTLENLDNGNDLKAKRVEDKRDGTLVTSPTSRKSRVKRVGIVSSSGVETGIASRTRHRRRGQKEVTDDKQDDKQGDKVAKIESKDRQSNAGEKSKTDDEEPEATTEGDKNSKQIIKRHDFDTTNDENTVSSSLPENTVIENEQNKTHAKDGAINQSPESKISPDKRVTRSTTGNLKPKQQFDEIQEKEELKVREKRKEENLKRGGTRGEHKSTLSEHKGKDEKKSPSEITNEESKLESSSDDNDDDGDEIDYHEDDSDYSPEDDPDRPWCICRKPHGNKFMICCDGCEEWFHGKCVGITMEQGKQMEKQGKEYVCDKCREKKAKEMQMAEKAKELAEAIKSRSETNTHDLQKKPARKTAPNNVVAEPDSSEKQPPVQSDDIKKRKVKEPPGFKIPKKVRTTPTPVSQVQTTRKCIVQGCPRTSYEGAVYCGRTCIERHVNEAAKMLSSKEHGGQLHTSEGNRVSMIEKSSGRLVAGMAAPVVTNLTEWILKNPSFQVLVSGNSPTSQAPTSFYNKVNAESKQKKEIDKKSEEDTVRSNVRRMMKDILVERKKESSEIRISVEEIMKLVRKIEDDMYKAFKDTSHRYKAKYRTLMFNLKDPRNKVLYKRVLTGDIPPEKLIWMTSDELATKELAQWREQETKHMIDMIKKEEENTNKARLIKKTHKGEVDVDDDDLSTLKATNIKEVVPEKKPKPEEKVEVAIIDTTEEHRAHLFDLNCKICTGKMAPPGEIVAKSPTMSNVPIQAAAESSIPSPPPIQEPSSYTEPLSPDSRGTPTDFSSLTEKPKESSVWKGFVMMQNVAKFGTNAFVVSGSGDNLIQVLPDTLHVAGRIAHKHVWDYVKQCKTSSSRELCIIRYAAATDDEKISYVSLYSYFHSRKRCGVIGNCQSGVKDMYLVPLASHEPVPSPLLPFNGPGLQEPRPHMLLGVIVKNKNIPAKRSRSGSDRVSSKTEPPSKRTSVDEPSSKSSTPSTKTSVKPSDSPVDEIEDIVFHYHNTQGGKLEPDKPAQPKPSQSSGIPPMISALLKIQQQEKKLRELQKQSELLEKELAPKVGNMPSTQTPTGQMASSSSSLLAAQIPDSTIGSNSIAGAKGSSDVTGHSSGAQETRGVVSNIFSGNNSNISGQVKGSKNLGFPAVISQSSLTSGGPSEEDGSKNTNGKGSTEEDEPYDPETADNEETPYDPEEMDTIDLSLDEIPSPEKGSAVLSPPKTADSVAQHAAPSKIVSQNLLGSDILGRLQQSMNTMNKTEPKLIHAQASEMINKSGGNIDQASIPRELQEKVHALLKPEQSNLVKHTDNQQAGTSPVGEERFGRGDLAPERGGTGGAYHHTRDFPEKRDFPETRDFSERRGYSEGRDDPKFYSSRFSLNARRVNNDEKGGHDRSYGRGRDRDYRSRDSRDYRDGNDRHWDDRGGRDDRRRDEYFNRNRERFQRGRNWRR